MIILLLSSFDEMYKLSSRSFRVFNELANFCVAMIL